MMNRRFFLKSVGVSVLALFKFPAMAETKPKKPNFLIVFADDISANTLGCFGSVNPGTSPHIDMLAKQGLRFENMYVSQAICAPARAELYTGLQPARNGCYRNHEATNKGTQSVAHYLGQLGYRVGLAGKRHYRPASVYPFEYINGFEKDSNRQKVGPANWQPAIDFMNRDKNQPFCLFLCSIHAHAPWDSGDSSAWKLDEVKLPPHFVDTPETRHYFREYLAEIKLFDAQVGKAVTALDKLGIADDTLLVVLDENGCGMPGGKWSTHDWGVRSACVMRWPGHIKPGTATDAVTQYCDVLPTLIEAAGGEASEDLDGKSMLNLIRAKSNTHRDHACFLFNSDQKEKDKRFRSRAIIDGHYRLIWNIDYPNANVVNVINGYEQGYVDKRYPNNRHVRLIYKSWVEKSKKDPQVQKWIDRYRNPPEFELYDIQADPWELDNLADKQEYAAVIKSLKKKLIAWMKQQKDPAVSDIVEQNGIQVND